MFTWYFRAALDSSADGGRVTMVRTAIGRPRWIRAEIAEAMEYANELMPWGLLSVTDEEVWRTKYRARLEKVGVAAIRLRLEAIAARNEWRPLVLLCYERDRKDCHRSEFAAWWQEQTGEEVPEYEATPDEDDDRPMHRVQVRIDGDSRDRRYTYDAPADVGEGSRVVVPTGAVGTVVQVGSDWSGAAIKRIVRVLPGTALF